MTVRAVLAGIGLGFVLFAIAALVRREAPRWRGELRPVLGRVTGYRSSSDVGTISYAPVYRFEAEGAVHEVVDQRYTGRRQPAEGTVVPLRYPAGRPELARPDRPWTMRYVFAALTGMAALLAGLLLGWIE